MKIKADKKTVVAGIALLCAALMLFVAFRFLLDLERGSSQREEHNSGAVAGTAEDHTNAPDERAHISFEGAWYALRDHMETLLFIGVDKYEVSQDAEGYRNSQQADFLLLLVFDTENKTYSALHLNRDTMTDIQVIGTFGDAAGTITGQLALSHTYGTGKEDSCRNTVKAVNNLLYGTTIDHYVSLTMNAVTILNDSIGGVTVEVLDDFSGIDDTLIKGETVTLRGDQALTYVRTRKDLDDSSNLHRMELQRQYIFALMDQYHSAMDQTSDLFLTTLWKVNEYMVSDCTVNQLSRYNTMLDEYTFGEYYTTEGEAIVGDEFMEYYIDEEALQKTLIDLFYEKVDAPN